MLQHRHWSFCLHLQVNGGQDLAEVSTAAWVCVNFSNVFQEASGKCYTINIIASKH